MIKTNIKITLGTAIFLGDIVNKILLEEFEDEKGNKKLRNRKLPFRLSYRLNRNKIALDKYLEIFNGKKMYLMAKFGTLTDDQKDVILKDQEAIDNYSKGVADVLKTSISHNIITIEEEDIDFIKDSIDLTKEDFELLIKYLIGDQEFLNNLSKEIKTNLQNFEDLKN